MLKSNKVISMDIAEMAPVYDIDQHTAKLASLICYNLIENR
ncbi:MAG: arginase family protein [Nitrospinota bacterium]|nr:arginase family protein [Nitrospinota bacterium]